MVRRAIIKRRIRRKAPTVVNVDKKIVKKEELTLKPSSTYSKLISIFVLIIAFCVGNFMVIQPTIKEATLVEADLTQKKSFLDTAEQTKLGLKKREQQLSEDLEELKNTFFLMSKPDEFYIIFSEAALSNQLSISSLAKVSEENYKKPKKDDPTQFEEFDKYKIVKYKMSIEGKFIDYIKFVEELNQENRSFVVDKSVIKEKDNGEVLIDSELTLSLTKL